MTLEVPSSANLSTPSKFCFISSLREIRCEDWNALLEDDHPFLRYEFLSALEYNDCLGDKFGWFPHHLVAYDKHNKLIAATPLYIKTNSYGEFVFDWSWASAYEQVGLSYYPKLVSSIPYTPVTGKRLLIKPDIVAEYKAAIANQMVAASLTEAKKLEMSGIHWLFNEVEECDYFKRHDLALRLGCQYHWHNQNYTSFDHFLETFISRKRKKVNRERRYVAEQNIAIKRLHGNELDDELWQQVHTFYASTFYRKSGFPTLSLEFFKQIGETMGSQVLLVFAYHDKQLVACAINFRSSDALYGRFWGCLKEYHSLHFEACYYQGIEYAIENKLSVFEPGAQGEHKISRGFIPTKTWSAHYIVDSQFRSTIRDFCNREESFMRQECEELMSLSPYRFD